MINEEKLGSFDDIDFDSIDNHGEIIKKIIREEKRAITFLVLGGSLFFISYALVAQQKWLLFVVLGGLFSYLIYAYAIATDRYFRQLAEKNNLWYQKFFPLDDFKSNLKNVAGAPSNPRSVIAGNYRNKRARFFYYNYTVQHGKNSTTYPFTFFEVFFNEVNFPHTLLHFNGRSFLKAYRHGRRRSGEIEVSLEDGYKKTYSLYIQDGYGVEAMQIFTTDFLDFLIDEKFDYSIELSENRLYIYTKGTLMKKDDLKELFTTADEMLKRMTPILNRLKKDFNTLHETYNR